MKNKFHNESFIKYPIFNELEKNQIENFTKKMEINNYSKNEIT